MLKLLKYNKLNCLNLPIINIIYNNIIKSSINFIMRKNYSKIYIKRYVIICLINKNYMLKMSIETKISIDLHEFLYYNYANVNPV